MIIIFPAAFLKTFLVLVFNYRFYLLSEQKL